LRQRHGRSAEVHDQGRDALHVRIAMKHVGCWPLAVGRSAILAVLALLLVACYGQRPTANSQRLLRVCADPNDLPYSNIAQQGFENKIASLIARDLRAEVQYTWWPQRRGFVRNTLKAGDCDMIPGVPSN